MKEVVLTTTFPHRNRLAYGVRRDGRWLHEGIGLDYADAALEPGQSAALEAGRALMQALAEDHAGDLPVGQSVRLETTQPGTNGIEYSITEGAALLRHGVAFTFNPATLSGGDVALLLAARAVLQGLAETEAQAQGLL